MCGILGIASKHPQETRGWLSEGALALVHRGPDDGGEWWSLDGSIGLAHRRLSIVDLTSAGRQPMHDERNELHIVFNGEIYNFLQLRSELEKKGHFFRTHSDTEVIINAYREWGTSCLERFNGMFALAIFDSSKKILFIARDRAGEKPLFYHLSSGVIRFGSELKALLKDSRLSRQISPTALDAYLSIGYAPHDLCLLSGFSKLPPAHALIFNLESGDSKVWRYWEMPALGASIDSEDDSLLIEELEVLLENSVRMQMTADVPVGVLLSGGVDSSLIVAMASRINTNVNTFTVGFPGYEKLDETKHARLIAKYFGTKHVELMADDVNADILLMLAKQFDEPIVDSSMIPTFLVSKLVRDHCKVALGGDGGDELFGGYNHYSRLLFMQENFNWMPTLLKKGAAYFSENVLPIGFKGRNWLQGFSADLDSGLPLISSYFDDKYRKVLFKKEFGQPAINKFFLNNYLVQDSDLLQRAMRTDFKNYLAEDILVKVDRASMINSLEIRSPFLDLNIINFAFSRVPSHKKATTYNKKILLKKMASRLLPKEFDNQRKQGFSVPLGDWLKVGSFCNLFKDVLLDKNCIFDPMLMRRLLDGQSAGRANSERLFSLVMLELWRNEYQVNF
jgi:asparagine synthase (glutamine-hydrolysing)